VEAIFLVVDGPDQKTTNACRFSHRDIARKIQIKGNIFDSIFEDNWNLSIHHSDQQDRIIIATDMFLN
jgi:hypothetical protein